MRGRGHLQQAAVGGDQLRPGELVEREAPAAHDPPDARPEGEATHADRAGVAGTDREAVTAEFRGHLSPGGAAADVDQSGTVGGRRYGLVHAYLVQGPEVHHERAGH